MAETTEILEARAALKSVNQLLYTLRERWADEREFEDFAEYGKAFAAALPPTARFIRATKRPFGFIAEIEGNKWHFFASGRKSGAKRVAA